MIPLLMKDGYQGEGIFPMCLDTYKCIKHLKHYLRTLLVWSSINRSKHLCKAFVQESCPLKPCCCHLSPGGKEHCCGRQELGHPAGVTILDLHTAALLSQHDGYRMSGHRDFLF